LNPGEIYHLWMDVNSHMMRFRMEQMEENIDSDAEALVANIRERARNLYQTRQMLCTEAVVAALNHGLHGGLTDAQATAMAAPFSAALGDSGCLCGALSGAVMASGLLIGKESTPSTPPKICGTAPASCTTRSNSPTVPPAAGCCPEQSRMIKRPISSSVPV
jgi:hypothetical protein